MQEFFFWWSIVSTIISIILLCFSIWQVAIGFNKEAKNKAQVKIWMHDANGVSTSLQRIVRDNIDGRYSSTNDVCNAIWAVQSSAFALYQGLYEERCVTEKEYKEKQKKIEELIDKKQSEKFLKNQS